jgi:protein TonB
MTATTPIRHVGMAALLAWATPVGAQHLKALISPDDYPATAVARHEQGTVFYRLTVGLDGRIKACQVTRSSGFADLDAATCSLLERRARFQPKLGPNGSAIEFTNDDRIKWSLP